MEYSNHNMGNQQPPQQPQQPQQPPQQQPQQLLPNDLSVVLKAWFSKDPLSAYHVYIAPKNVWILLGISAAVGIFFFAFLAVAFPSMAAGSLGGLGSMMGHAMGGIFGKGILFGILNSALMGALIIGVSLLIAKVVYGDFYTQIVLSLLAVTAVPFTATMLVGGLLMLIIPALAVPVLLFVVSISLVSLYAGFKIYFANVERSMYWAYFGFTFLLILVSYFLTTLNIGFCIRSAFGF